MNQLLQDARELSREAWRATRARPLLFFALIPLAILATVIFFFPRDVAISAWCYQGRFEFVRDVARRFSAYGDFRLTIELFVVFVALGIRKKRRDWQRLGLAILLAASLAGAVATTVRTLSGRPRPSAFLPDKFGGPNFTNHKLQSFPSAHAATSMATAGVVAVAMPAVGIPFLIFSTGVPWARFYMNDHYISDITVGSLVGLWFGIAFGRAQRKLGGDAGHP